MPPTSNAIGWEFLSPFCRGPGRECCGWVRHIEGTALPGETGNSGIAGHRDTFFRELKDIQRNDEIQIQTATGLFRYQVDWMRVVEPGDTTVLEPSYKESTVTLVTCYPFYFVGSAPKRVVVRAHRH